MSKRAGRDFDGDSDSRAMECVSCGLYSVCGGSASAGADAPLSGPPLALFAVGFFFLPLAAALGGAMLGGSEPLGQLLGGSLGLGVGMLLARTLARLLCRGADESTRGVES